MKKFLALLLTLALVFSLAGCAVIDTVTGFAQNTLFSVTALVGSFKADEALLGRYNGALAQYGNDIMFLSDVYEGESYIRLDKMGNCTVVLSGTTVEGKFKLAENGIILNLGGQLITGTLNDGLLVLDWMDTGYTLTFCLEGLDPPLPPLPEVLNAIHMRAGTAEYLGCRLVRDAEGARAIAITLNFTNEGKTETSFFDCFSYVPTQGEEILMPALVWVDDTTAMDDGIYAPVMAGGNLEVTLTYPLTDMELPIVMEFYDAKEDRTDILTVSPENAQPLSVVGYYEIESMVLADGTVIDKELMDASGVSDTTYLLLEEGGVGRICMAREEFSLTYDETTLDADGDVVEYYIDENGLLVITMDQMSLSFRYSTNTPPAPGSMDLTSALAGDYEGDWFGTMVVYDAVGFYEGDIDVTFECFCRMVFNVDGSCTLYLTAGMDSDFQYITANVLEDDYYIIPDGYIFDLELTDDSFLIVDGGILYVDLYGDDGQGNSMNLYAMLRPFGDFSWDSASDYPCMSQEAIEYYSGMSVEEILTFWEVDLSNLPAA